MNRLAMASENLLLESLRRGDRDAFTQIYRRYWEPLYRTAYCRLHVRESAEEIVQDLFIQLWERRETQHIDRLENYLFRAVRNAVIDYIRREISQNRRLEYYQLFMLTDDDSGEGDSLEVAQQQLNRGIELLPDKTRQIFVLHRLKGWPVERLAQHYALSDKAIEYHLTKSLKVLRLYLRNALYCTMLLPLA